MELSRLTDTLKSIPHTRDLHDEDKENLFAAVMFMTAIDSEYLIPYPRMIEKINEVMALPEDSRRKVLANFFGI